MWELLMRNWDLREFRVRVNLPSPIQQVWDWIRCVITSIQCFPNPITQVLPLIIRIRSYPPHHSHLHPPSLSFSSTPLTSLQNTMAIYQSLSLHVMIMSWHRVQYIPSTAYPKYSIHWVQHTLSTQGCLSSLHSHNYKLTPECSFSFCCASLHDRLPSSSSSWGLKGKDTLLHSDSCELSNWWIESQHLVRRPLTTSKYWSKLAWLRPPSSLDHGLPRYLQTSSITACKFAQLRPPIAFPNSLNPSLQVYLETRTITASKCISKLPPSRPWSVSLSSLYRHFQTHLELLSSTTCS